MPFVANVTPLLHPLDVILQAIKGLTKWQRTANVMLQVSKGSVKDLIQPKINIQVKSARLILHGKVVHGTSSCS